MDENQQQLSRILQQHLSPVHAASQMPQSYNFMYGRPDMNFVGTPGVQSPHYQEQYDLGKTAGRAISGWVQNAALRQDIHQQAPGHWFAGEGSKLAVDPLTKRLAAAEELSIKDSSNYGFNMPFVGNTAGVFNTAITAASLIPGVRLGVKAGMALGITGNMAFGALDKAIFGRARDLRQGGMMLRGSLGVGATGTSFGLDESGIMRHDVAQDLTNQITRLGQTDARFSPKQFLQLTDKMAQMGMMQGVQSSDEIVNRVKQVSKQLKIFMKVANEPDMLNALKEMAQLRNMGISDANLTQAASNARTFARMSGLTREQVLQAGATGAQTFQSMGLSAASGHQMGMLTTGLAGQNLGMFSRGMLNNLGGAQGLSAAMTQGVAGAQRHVTMDMLMHSVFNSKGGGRFSLDTSALNDIMRGGNLSALFDKKTRAMNADGTTMQHVQDMNERRSELREALQQRLGSTGMMLLTLRQGQALQQASGGNMTLFSALERVTGGNTQAARVLSRVASSPDSMSNLVSNMQHEQRRRTMAERDEIEYQGSIGSYFRRSARSAFDFGFSRYVASFNARRAQEQRDMAMGTYGRDMDADRLLNMNQDQRARAMALVTSGGAGGGLYGVDQIDSSTGVPSFAASPWNYLTGHGVQSRVAQEFSGYAANMGRIRRSIGRFNAFVNKYTYNLLPSSPITRMFHSDLDTMSNEEITRRAMDAGRISRIALEGDSRSLASAAKHSLSANNEFFKGMDITDDERRSLTREAMSALDATFYKRKGYVNEDAKVDFVDTKKAIVDRLVKSGVSREEAEKRVSGKSGDKFVASLVRSRMATKNDTNYYRDRAQLGDHFSADGQTFDKMQEKLLSKITGASNTTRDGLLGYVANTGLDREEASQLVSVLGSSGATTKAEMRQATEIARILALREKGKLSGEGLNESVQKLMTGKSETERKKIMAMMGSIEKQFGSLSQKSDISSVLSQSKFDVNKFADAAAENVDGIRAIAIQKNMATRLKEDFGINIESGKNVISELTRMANDSDFVSGLKKGGGAGERLGSMLQNVREGRKGAAEDLAKFVAGRDRERTGLTYHGGTTDPAAKSQLAMARGLQDFASQNARATARFGGVVDRMSNLIGDSGKGASLASVVDSFKEAVDKFSGSKLITK